jgi:hypothetical protein
MLFAGLDIKQTEEGRLQTSGHACLHLPDGLLTSENPTEPAEKMPLAKGAYV